MDKSPIVTLNGLNTVYTDLLKRIEALGNIYHINGSYDTLDALIKDKKSAEKGEAYNVVHDRPYDNPKDYPEGYDPVVDDPIEENANYVCYNGYTDGACTIENWTKYWFRINSAFEVANDKSLGLIRLFGTGKGDTSSTTTDKFVNRELLLDTEDRAYVSIPVASPYTYGVVDVNAQAFKGEKTFNDSATFEKGATITGKLSTSSVSDATNSLVIAPTDADTEVGDVYVGGTLTVVNDAVFNDVKGKDHSLLLTEANDTLDYGGHPVNSENSPSTSTIGNMNVGGTLTVSNSANVKTVEASNATFNINNEATINTLKAIGATSADTANLTVGSTAEVGTVNAESATFNINEKATIANLSATNLNVKNGNTDFAYKDSEDVSKVWNQVNTLNVTSTDTSNPAELNVSTRADISNVSATNLNATTINANEFNGGTGANKGKLSLSYGTSANVKNITCTGTLNCSGINVSTVSSSDGTLMFEQSSTVSSIQRIATTRETTINATTIDVKTLKGSSDGTTIDKDLTFTDSAEVTTIANKSTEVNAEVIDVNKVYSSQGTLEFTDTTQNSIVSSIQKTASRDTVINATTIDVKTLKGSSDGTTIDKDLTFTDFAKVKNIENKETTLTADTITVRELSGSGKTLTFTGAATIKDVEGKQKLTADTITVGELSGSGKTLTFTDAATVSNITDTQTLKATVIDVNKLSSNSGTLNVGDGGTVTTNGVSINGSTGNVVATTFEVRGAGTFEKKADNVVNLTQALYIASPNASGSVPSATSYALGVNGGIYAPRIKGEKVYGAVWNDLVDCIEVDDECELEYGRCYAYNNGKFTKTSKYADKSYIGIHSDTSGFEMGDKGDVKQLKSSVAGYVLAYVDAEYPSGTPLTCSKHGMLTKAHFLTRILHPERVIATYWKNEPKFVWGAEGNEIEVKGRHWVRIK